MMKNYFYIIISCLIIQFVSQKIIAQQPSTYIVKRMPFNSDLFSDISPVIVKDGIIFCSNRRFSVFTDLTAYDGHRLYNIYMAERKDSSDWGRTEEFNSERNSRFNNGPLCIAPDGRTVYFTSEVETGPAALKRNFVNHSGIFVATMSGTNLDSIRPFKYNSSQYEVAQPSISSDGKFLFFASDMPGGQGKSDLWYCEFINGDWASPVNLGPGVNSSDVENFPYLHPTGRLYFSSDRPGGIGNLDVYFTSKTLDKWDDPVRLPEPINSTFDDFGLVAESNFQNGYFATNRRKSDDIFKFTSTIIRKATCDTLRENSYCYRFLEENAVKYDSMPFRYEWNFGDGNKAEGVVVEHCYSGPGKYTVQLDVVNLITKEVKYNEKTDTLLITAIVQPYISGPDEVTAGIPIKLSADSTNLPGWKIAQYYWNFDDESIEIGKDVVKMYSKPGTYNVQLIVSTEPEKGGVVREACISKNIIVIPKP